MILLLSMALGCTQCRTQQRQQEPGEGLVFNLRQDGFWYVEDHTLKKRLVQGSVTHFPWRGKVKVGSLEALPGKPWPLEYDLRVDLRNLSRRPGLVEELILAVVGEQVNDSQGRATALATTSISPAFTTAGVPLTFYYPGRLPVRALGDREGSPFEMIKRFPARQWRGRSTAWLKGRLDLTLPRDIPAGFYRPHVEIYARLKGSRTPITLGRLGFFLKFSDRWIHTLPGWELKKLMGLPEAGTLDFMDNPQVLPRVKVGSPAAPRMPWVIFHEDEYHGMSGLLSAEDQQTHGMLQRARLPTAYRLAPGLYNVQPGLPTLTPLSTLAGMFITPTGPEIITHYFGGQGRVRAWLRPPGGAEQYLGEKSITGIDVRGAHLSGGGFALDLRRTGDYELRLSGTMHDKYQRAYAGGGTYRFTVALPLSFSSAAKPGTNFIAGARFPAVMHINPAVPAEVRYEVGYYPNSDPGRRQQMVHAGRANPYGHFVPQEPFLALEEPGEYRSRFEARFLDSAGNLWMGAQTSAGVVAPAKGDLVLHGGLRYPGPKDPHKKSPQEGLRGRGALRQLHRVPLRQHGRGQLRRPAIPHPLSQRRHPLRRRVLPL